MDEIIVDIELSDELIVEVLQDDDITVTVKDADEIDVEAFDYPPEIDLLNQRVTNVEQNSLDAVATSNSASELAAQSAQMATKATQVALSAEQSASEAAAIAGEALQAANEATEAAGNARQTANQAAQSIDQHAQSNNNPHPTTITQEFAEANITGLKSSASGGFVSATIYTWFKGLFPSLVDGSVKSYIIGLLSVVKDLATRVATFENDIQDFSLTVSQDVASVELTNLNIPKGAIIHLTADWTYTADVPSSVYRLEFNDVVTGYMNTGLSATAYINLYTPLTDDGQTQAVIYYADTITAISQNIRKATGTSPTLLNLMSSRPNFPYNVINTIRIRTAESAKVIAAGTKINVKVIK